MESTFSTDKSSKKTADIEVICRGISPLLMDSCKELEAILNGEICHWQPTKKSRRQQCEDLIFRGSNGEIGLPSGRLLAALRDAGRYVQVGQRRISTARATRVDSILSLKDSFLPLIDPASGRLLNDHDWRLHNEKRELQKAEVEICRPRFDHWGFRVRLGVDYSEMPGLIELHILKLFEFAGRRIGLGEFRPANFGRFGRFEVKELNSISVP